VLLRIAPETQTGRTIRLAGKGMPRFRADGRGDLYVKVRVVLPTGLDDRAKELATAFLDHVRQPDPRTADRRRPRRRLSLRQPASDVLRRSWPPSDAAVRCRRPMRGHKVAPVSGALGSRCGWVADRATTR
jgi:hypothetical protein